MRQSMLNKKSMRTSASLAISSGFNRRSFLAAAGATALKTLVEPATSTAQAPCQAQPREFLTGNGEWTYRVVSEWGHLPAGTEFGGTHGGIATDNAGRVYISTQSATGVLVYSPEGTLLKQILSNNPEGL